MVILNKGTLDEVTLRVVLESELHGREYFDHYDTLAEYRAARFYYEIVVRDFSDTGYGPRAEDRLKQIAGLPDKPAKKAEWLVDLFPEAKETKPLIISNTPTGSK